MRRARTVLAAFAILAAGLVLAACAPATAGLPGLLAPAPAPVPTIEPTSGAPAAPEPSAGEPSRARSGAFVVGTGPAVTVELWVDYFCPYCRMFEDANGDYLQSLLDDGQVTLLIHPISFLDRASMGTKYSTRAANAASCVAEFEPDGYWAFHRRLYAVQPEEGTEGLSDDELIDLAPDSGTVIDCIREQRFSGWIARETQEAVDAGVRGTPTVYVNGQRFGGHPDDRDAFRAFVGSATAKV